MLPLYHYVQKWTVNNWGFNTFTIYNDVLVSMAFIPLAFFPPSPLARPFEMPIIIAEDKWAVKLPSPSVKNCRFDVNPGSDGVIPARASCLYRVCRSAPTALWGNRLKGVAKIYCFRFLHTCRNTAVDRAGWQSGECTKRLSGMHFKFCIQTRALPACRTYWLPHHGLLNADLLSNYQLVREKTLWHRTNGMHNLDRNAKKEQ